MRILLSFQLCLHPLCSLDEEKSPGCLLGLGVFLLPPHNWLSMCGEEDLNYSPCEAMAPPMEPKPMRMSFSFPLFQLGCNMPGKNFILHDPDQIVGWETGLQKGAGVLRGGGAPICPLQHEDRIDFTLLNKENLNLYCVVSAYRNLNWDLKRK